ncbi:MAG TPA: hypothetical protein VHC69_00785 [Polyangiaceae bacterium]|nr:hypothetical protein [Polyangiaceae bacterium]
MPSRRSARVTVGGDTVVGAVKLLTQVPPPDPRADDVLRAVYAAL